MTTRTVLSQNQQFYSELIYYARARGYKDGWSAYKYKEKYGSFPKGLHTNPTPISHKTSSWVRSRNIAWAKMNENK